MDKSIRVPKAEMTIEKQIKRANELYPNKVNQLNLKDMIMFANSVDTTYIVYGIKDND